MLQGVTNKNKLGLHLMLVTLHMWFTIGVDGKKRNGMSVYYTLTCNVHSPFPVHDCVVMGGGLVPSCNRWTIC